MQLIQFLTNCGTQLIVFGVDNSGRNWYTWSGHLGTQLIQFLDRGTKHVLTRVDHPPPARDEVKKMIELYLYIPSGPSWPVIGRNLHFSTTVNCQVAKKNAN